MPTIGLWLKWRNMYVLLKTRMTHVRRHEHGDLFLSHRYLFDNRIKRIHLATTMLLDFIWKITFRYRIQRRRAYDPNTAVTVLRVSEESFRSDIKCRIMVKFVYRSETRRQTRTRSSVAFGEAKTFGIICFFPKTILFLFIQ